MKSIVRLLLPITSCLGSLQAAQPPQYRLEFSFEGMNQKWLADVSKESRSRVEIKNGVMPFFHAVVMPDQQASLQLLGEVATRKTIADGEKVLCGVIIDFKPIAKDGSIVLSGTSRLRRSIPDGGSQSSTWNSFQTEEATFSGEVMLGKPTVIAETGEGEGRTKLIVRVIAVDTAGVPITK